MKNLNSTHLMLWSLFVGFTSMILIDMIIDNRSPIRIIIQVGLVIWGMYNTRKFYLKLRRK